MTEFISIWEWTGDTPLQWLFETSLKVSLTLLLLGAIALMMRKASASVRHWVWLIAVLTALIAPAGVLLLPSWNGLEYSPMSLPVESAPSTRLSVTGEETGIAGSVGSEEAGALAEPLLTGDENSTSDLETASTMAMNENPRVVQWWLFSVWLTGVAFGATVLAISHFKLRRIVKQGVPMADEALRSEIRNVGNELKLRRIPAVRLSESGSMPLTCGAIRPRLLLPEEFPQWTVTRRRMVLLHEMAHVRRRDCLWQWLGYVACCFHWFNPLVWFAVRRMRIESENAADDLVLVHGETASSYAEELLDISTGCCREVPALCAATAMVRKTPLETRIRSILDSTRKRQPLAWKWFVVFAILGGTMLVPILMLRAAEGNNLDQTATGTNTEVEMIADSDSVVAQESEIEFSYEPVAELPPNAPDNLTEEQLIAIDAIQKNRESISFDSETGLPTIRWSFHSLWQPEDPDLFSYMMAFPDIAYLQLVGRAIGDEQMTFLRRVKRIGYLELLNCDSLTPAAYQNLSHLDDLTDIRVQSDKFTDAHLEVISEYKSLTRLSLEDTAITDDGLEFLKRLPSLRGLNLEGAKITEKGAATLAGIPSLEEVYLHDSTIDDQSVAYLVNLPNLKRLGFEGTRVTAEALNILKNNRPDMVEFMTLSTSEQLAPEAIASLSSFPNLRDVWLTGPDATDEIVQEALRQLNPEKITRLVLENSKATEAGLSVIGRFQNLEILSLGDTPLNNEALKHIGQLRNLEILHLDGTDVSDEGLDYLDEMDSLTYLNLFNTAVTKSRAEAFEAEHTGVRVNSGGL